MLHFKWSVREALKKNRGKNEIGTFSSDTPPPYPKSEKNNSENWFTVLTPSLPIEIVNKITNFEAEICNFPMLCVENEPKKGIKCLF